MNTLTAEEVRDHFEETLDRTCSDHNPVGVRREGKQPVVIVAARDLARLVDEPGMAETLYLLSSSKNERRLKESIEQIEKGDVVCPDPAIFEDT